MSATDAGTLSASVRERAHRISAVAAFVVADRALAATGIKAPPPQLVGMAALFVVLLVIEHLAGVACADMVFHALEPGYRFLMKWAPVFFIPALVRLPLVEVSFSFGQFVRIILLLVLGSMFQMKLAARFAAAFPPAVEVLKEPVPEVSANYPRPVRPYKRRWLPAYAVLMALSVFAARMGFAPNSAEALFAIAAGLLAFVCGASLPASVRTLLHPIFVGVAGSWLAFVLWPGVDFKVLLQRYTVGAGALLSSLLGPLVLALALLLYERRALLRRDWRAVVCTSSLSAFTGLVSTAVLARVLGVPSAVGLAALTRFCTAALALPAAAVLGASQPLAVAMVVLSGFLGVLLGRSLLTHVREPRDRGLAVGSVSHVLGTVSLASWGEASAVPYSALAFVLASGATVLFTAVPLVRALLHAIIGSESGPGVF